MNMHNCSLVPKTILKLNINVFFSLRGREKSTYLTTTDCVCLFKFSNLYNQFTNDYISTNPVNSYVFLMQALFYLDYFFFFSQENVPHEEECVGVVRMNDFQAVRTLWPHVP